MSHSSNKPYVMEHLSEKNLLICLLCLPLWAGNHSCSFLLIRNVKYSRLPSNKQEPKGLPSQPAGLISLSFRRVVSVGQKLWCTSNAVHCPSGEAPSEAVNFQPSPAQGCLLCFWFSLPFVLHSEKNKFWNILALLFRLFPPFLAFFSKIYSCFYCSLPCKFLAKCFHSKYSPNI